MPKNMPHVDCSTRRKRRTVLSSLVRTLEQIVEGEITYRDNMPDNFYGSDAYEDADNNISLLEEALDVLHSVYV